jgi:hypothetical protein
MVIRKNVDVNLLDQFILYKGLPFQFAGGFRHQTSDTIVIITPEFLKRNYLEIKKENTPSNLWDIINFLRILEIVSK